MKSTSIIVLQLFISFLSLAQTIGINSTGAVADNSAMLDVLAADKGLLIPRVNIVDLTTAAPITGPATSLLVYNMNATSGVGFYFWDGAKWTKLADANSNSDEDWHEVGGTTAPDDINDNIFTQGNVGIGMANPQIKLVVSEGNSTNSSISLEGFSSGYLGLPTILPASGSHFGGIVHGGTNGQLILGIRENDVNDGLLIVSGSGDYMMDNTYDNAIFFARNDGNVGIGTVTPSRRLHVSGSGIGVQKFKIEETSPGGESLSLGNGTAASTFAFSNTGNFWLGGVANVDNNMIATDADVLIEGTTGNVGIGTAAPDEKLHVTGNIAIDSYQLGAGNGIFFRDGFNASVSPYNMSIIADTFDGGTSPDALSINGFEGVSISTGHNTVLQRRLTIVNNGNVGIGTTNPSTILQVVGILEYADNAAALAGGLTVGAFYRTGDLLKVVH